jgi:hypothetical protein
MDPDQELILMELEEIARQLKAIAETIKKIEQEGIIAYGRA